MLEQKRKYRAENREAINERQRNRRQEQANVQIQG
jgi:hypothetical protein